MSKLTAACMIALGLGCLATASFADPGRSASEQCYVWANEHTRAIGSAYSPSSIYSFNAVGRAAANSVVRTAIGSYTVTCKGVGGGPLFGGSGTWGAGGHVQVTSYGTEDADYCKVGGWSTGGADFSATVRCYNHQGILSDNRFDLLFVW